MENNQLLARLFKSRSFFKSFYRVNLDSENFSTLLEQIRAAVERADRYEKAVISTDTQGLSDKARHAIVASENQMRSELPEQTHENER